MLMIEIDLEVCFDPSKTAPTALGRITMLMEIDFNVRLDSLKAAPTANHPEHQHYDRNDCCCFLTLQKLVVQSLRYI